MKSPTLKESCSYVFRDISLIDFKTLTKEQIRECLLNNDIGSSLKNLVFYNKYIANLDFSTIPDNYDEDNIENVDSQNTTFENDGNMMDLLINEMVDNTVNNSNTWKDLFANSYLDPETLTLDYNPKDHQIFNFRNKVNNCTSFDNTKLTLNEVFTSINQTIRYGNHVMINLSDNNLTDLDFIRYCDEDDSRAKTERSRLCLFDLISNYTETRSNISLDLGGNKMPITRESPSYIDEFLQMITNPAIEYVVYPSGINIKYILEYSMQYDKNNENTTSVFDAVINKSIWYPFEINSSRMKEILNDIYHPYVDTMLKTHSDFYERRY